MTRLPYVSREDVPPDKRPIYDRIAESRGRVYNVFQVLLNSPDAAEALSGLGEYLRYRSPLDPVTREVAILSTASELDSEYEWAQHESVAREVGVQDEVIESIRRGGAPTGLHAREGIIAQAARELVRTATLCENTFLAIKDLLGQQQTVDLIVLVGYYSMLARVIAALDVELDEGLEAVLVVLKQM